jgi:two-component system response regulator (stage 0 sporulation protein A)
MKMEKKIYNLLNKVGVPFNLKGRGYIGTAIEIVYNNENISVTKQLYPEIAKKHNTTPTRVERAIRHAVETVFYYADLDNLQDMFGNTIGKYSGKLTNSAFIIALVEYLKKNYEEN